ncbi:MAG: leucine-rich repeat domain-containing protein [Clostridia bacterium]|nr:leucine-rich repeat domain-containing protein [Clostridia bacterium]
MAQVTHRRIGASAGFDPAGEGGRPILSHNLYRDYAVPGEPSWRTVPGFRLHASLSEKINGIFPFANGVLHASETAGRLWLVHAGTSLYLVRADDGSKRKFLGLTLSDHESRGCVFDGWFYLLDGTNFVRVRTVPQEGSDPVFESESVGGYVPICYLNGEPYEPANLLSGVYRVAADLSDPGGFYDTGFRYGRAGREGEAILLSASDAAGDVYLPETVSVDGETLRLTEIGAHAFDGNLTVTGVVCPDGIIRIGSSAFRGCTALAAFSGGEELTRIGLSAFRGCTALTTVVLPGTLRWIRSYAFYGCSALANLHYGGDDFSAEVGVSILGNSPIVQLTPINGSEGSAEFGNAYTLTLDAPADEVTGVTLDGVSIWEGRGDPVYSVETVDGKAVAVRVTTTDRRKLCGKRLAVTVSASARRAGTGTVREAFPRYTGEIPAMIRRCRLITVFDGRLFLSGNPDIPDAIFYSCRTASGAMDGGYYGVYQYFRDGAGRDAVVSLIAGPDSLTVFTAGEGRGGVFRHKAASTGDDQLPRIYPREGGNDLPGGVGDAILYRDAPVFATSSGILSVLPTGLGYERSTVCRSEGIASLFPPDPSSVRLAVWDGYLAVFLPGGEVLLGDGRQRREQPSEGAGFEWWRLSGIGGYANDRAVYRFSSALTSGAAALGITLAPPAMQDTEAEGTVVDEDGTLSVTVGTDRYAVYGGRERAGGTLLAPIAVAARGEELLFGTETGDLYRFNTDKRGVPPTSELAGMTAGDLARYREERPGEIAPEWYDFAGHPIPVALETAPDEGGLVTSRKNTVSGSAFLDLDLMPRSAFSLSVKSDGKTPDQSFRISANGADFSALDFADFSFAPCGVGTAVFREKCRLWHRKRYLIRSGEFDSPISVRAILYRAEEAGKVKGP